MKFLEITEAKIKTVAIFCFLFITFALLITQNDIATGYESSIYASTPLILWASIILSMISGICIVLHQTFTENYKKTNKLVITGFLLVVLSSVMCLALYLIRGYYMWGLMGDPATHLGMIKNILTTGHTPDFLFYPILHVFTSEMILITGLPLEFLYELIPLYLYIIFVTFMFLISRKILPHQKSVIITSLISLALIYGWYLNFTPNHATNLIFPLVIFIVLMNFIEKKIQWGILFVITVLLVPPFHTVPAIVLILILGSFWLPKRIYNRFSGSSIRSLGMKFNLLNTSVLLLIVFTITWVSSFYIWNRAVENIQTLLTEGGTTHLSKIFTSVSNAQLQGFDVVTYAMKIYAADFVIVLFTVLSLPILWKSLKNSNKYEHLFLLYGPLVVIGLIMVVFNFGNLMFGPNRLLIYIIIFGTFFAGFFLHKIIKMSKSSKYKLIKFTPFAIAFIIIGVFISGVLSLYPSPYTLNSNPQSTYMDESGMKWYFDNGNIAYNVSVITTERGRYADLFDINLRRTKTPYRYSNEILPPYHFEYNNTLDGKRMYMILTKKDEKLYTSLFPALADKRWYLDDFKNLDSNMNFDKIYSDGELSIRFVDNFKK